MEAMGSICTILGTELSPSVGQPWGGVEAASPHLGDGAELPWRAHPKAGTNLVQLLPQNPNVCSWPRG